ncbi:hypothetical protein AJ88_01125 [Mesorhizobium amorphae CCBAU 01583]|nr:hypothetical protein AJ88_01125 [Mesorhizobium amorphae CCBAU 01583]
MDQPPAPARVERALRAFGILHGKAPLSFGLGIDEIGQRLRLNQIEFAVEKGAACELAGLGMPDAVEASDRLQHFHGHGATAMNMEFGHIFAGEASRTREKQNQAIVDHRSVVRPELAQDRDAVLNLTASNRFDHESSLRTGNTDHGDAGGQASAGKRNNGLS